MAFYASVFGYEYQGVAFQVWASAPFWFTLILTNVILIVPIVAYRFYMTNVKATLSDRVRMKQRLTKSKAKAREIPFFRRASTFRRSARSMRSGYAFAHSEGFGELITSGINMRDRVGSVQLGAPVTLKNVRKIDESDSAVRGNWKNREVATTPPNMVSPQTGEKILYSERL